ncbi:MAG: HD domain-containing protein [Bacilli bacterium]|nr:HD domain-containing protein [Bacilli bacterium]
MDYKSLEEILLSDKPSVLIKKNEKAIFNFIPDLEKSKNFEQHNIWHVYDVYEHILHVVDEVPVNIISRLTALFHDIGKPDAFTQDENGVGHFYGHWDISKKIFLKFAANNNLDENITKRVARLIEYHDIRIETMSDEDIKKIIKDFDEEDIELLFLQKNSDLLAQNSIYHHLLDSYEEQRKRVLNIYKTLI